MGTDELKATKKEGLGAAVKAVREREEASASSPPPASASEPPAKASSRPPPARDSESDKPTKRMRPALMLARYSTPGQLMHAAEKLRDAGYRSFDAHSPFPIHGMDRAMGLPDSRLGWIVLVFGLTGTTAAFSMMYWMNGMDYPLIVGGKPPGAVPSMVPIMFELTILFSAFAAVFGMFHLNKLPRHHHPIFESDNFASCSDDKFFISVESSDPKFKLDKTRELLDATHAETIEVIEEEVA